MLAILDQYLKQLQYMTEIIKEPSDTIESDNNLLVGLHGLLSNGYGNLSSLLKASMSFTQIKN